MPFQDARPRFSSGTGLQPRRLSQTYPYQDLGAETDRQTHWDSMRAATLPLGPVSVPLVGSHAFRQGAGDRYGVYLWVVLERSSAEASLIFDGYERQDMYV